MNLQKYSFTIKRRTMAFLDAGREWVNAFRWLQAKFQVELDALLKSVWNMAFEGEL